MDAPTAGQSRLLQFFGKTAATKAEAHEALTKLLADPFNAKRWLLERARRYLRNFPALRRDKDDPQDSHGELFKAAIACVHGFALDDVDAFAVLRDYANGSDQPWSDYEVSYKVRSARNSVTDRERGYLLGDEPAPGAAASTAAPAVSAPVARPAPAAKVEFDPERLRGLAEPWRQIVKLPWLANRSAVDPATVTPAMFLHLLYRPGEKVLCFTNQKSQGQALWPDQPPPDAGPEGVWFLPQPVSGQVLPNPRTGNTSRRSEESVTAFRYMVLESDQADACDWLGLIVRMPLRIEAIYTSGGRSVHALVRVDCPTKRAWDDYKDELAPTINLLCLGGLDPKVITAVRLTRLPGCLRAGKLQKLLYVRPNPPVRPICEITPVRDVEALWPATAALGVSDEDGGDAVRSALEFYAPASKACRAALAGFKAAQAAAGFDERT